jgi:galactofuranosylgalactofuranosylrhamnosyl-N-acetylglucosaminyl-diphospho-decaprenol beta-1,5/1,6-galactofuranosyltransferase
MAFTFIQRLVLPNHSNLGLPESLYYAGRHRALLHKDLEALELLPGGEIDLLSYFNAFSLSHWREALDLNSVGLKICFSGELIVSVELHRRASGKSVLFEQKLSSASEDQFLVDGAFSNLGAVVSNEIASIRLSSNHGGILRSCNWFTTQQPRADLKVGIIVTHFNRQQWVIPAVERFRRDLLSDPEFSGHCELVVVDNSRNLQLEEAPGLVRLPSHNYGCSGGFAKGLSYLAETGKFTHAIFMDDDATCEIESLKRIINFFQFSRSNQSAIAGTLFCEPHFDRVHEAGASWGAGWQPRLNGLRAVGSKNLLKLVAGGSRPTYGGWWCFGFPIHSETAWPFPFFVRGDDISFSLANKYRILVPLGVACWGDSFRIKDSPWLKYLDGRMHTLPALVFRTCNIVALLKRLLATCVGCLLCYRYASAQMFLLGARDSLRDASFWERNADAYKLKLAYQPLIQAEAFGHAPSMIGAVSRTIKKEPWWRAVARKVSLGGYLLPQAFLKGGCALVSKDNPHPAPLVFPYASVRFINTITNEFCDSHRSLWKATLVLAQFAALAPRICYAYWFRPDHFRNVFNRLSTKESWQRLFAEQAAGE